MAENDDENHLGIGPARRRNTCLILMSTQDSRSDFPSVVRVRPPAPWLKFAIDERLAQLHVKFWERVWSMRSRKWRNG